MEVACPIETIDPVEEGKLLRIVPNSLANVLHLAPRLADRPIVVRSETTIQLLSGARITLHVSSPLWVEVETGEPPGTVLERPNVAHHGYLVRANDDPGRAVLRDQDHRPAPLGESPPSQAPRNHPDSARKRGQ